MTRNVPEPPKPCRTIIENDVRSVNENRELCGLMGMRPTLVNTFLRRGQLKDAVQLFVMRRADRKRRWTATSKSIRSR